LVEQAEYLARNAGRDTALKFYLAADETFSLLASNPGMGRMRDFRSPRLSGLRMCLLIGFPKHLVFYRPTRHGVEIVRVLHGARDVEDL
jgi:toxin ParE1/3/4